MIDHLHPGTIISCPDCGKHLYKTKIYICIGESTDANHFEPLNNMPEEIQNTVPSNCNGCGGTWSELSKGRIHTKNGWWPHESRKEKDD